MDKIPTNSSYFDGEEGFDVEGSESQKPILQKNIHLGIEPKFESKLQLCFEKYIWTE